MWHLFDYFFVLLSQGLSNQIGYKRSVGAFTRMTLLSVLYYSLPEVAEVIFSTADMSKNHSVLSDWSLYAYGMQKNVLPM